MKKKIVWIAVSFLMALSLVLASCGPAAPEEEEEVIIPEEEEEEEEEVVEEEEIVAEGPKYGGTITFCTSQTLSSPNPVQAGPGRPMINSYTHEKTGVGDWTKSPAGTGEYDFSKGRFYYPFVGALAESWEQPDPHTLVLHIRQGVHWHNKPPVSGREMTADDIVYSIESLWAHPEVQTSFNSKWVESITALDKYTVEIKTNTLDFRVLDTLMIGPGTWIRPPETEETYGVGSTDIDAHCGTGPFVLTDFTSNASATLERNPDYWGYDELNPENRLPYADKVKYLMISEKSTYLAALRTGKIDVLTAVAINDAESLKQTSPETKYVAYLASGAQIISMRQDLEELPFSDIRVRKALNMAIDREAILNDYLGGQGEKFIFPIHPDCKGVHIPFDELPESTRENYEYNPDEAKQLLVEAGYPGGFQTECVTTQNSVEQLQILVAYWKAIGIDCEIKTVDQGTMMNLSFGKKYPQMVYGGSGISNDVYVLESLTTGHFLNYQMYSNPEFDAGVAVLVETQDEAEQNRIMKELSLLFLESAPVVPFPHQYEYNFWWPWLENYHGEVSLGCDMQGGVFARIWVDQELKKEMGY